MVITLCRQFTHFFLCIVHLVISPPSCDYNGEVFTIRRGRDMSEETTISTWEWNIRESYCSVQETKKSQVVKIEWYKKMYGLKREYAVATVKRARKTYYIRFGSREMRVAHSRVSGEDAFIARYVLGKAVVQSLTVAPDSKHKMQNDIQDEFQSQSLRIRDCTRKSVDQAFQVLSPSGLTMDDNGDIHLLASYEFKPGSLSLRDLVLTMSQVSESSQVCDVPLKQCYWFVYTVIGVLEDMYEPLVCKSSHFDKAGMYWAGSKFVGQIFSKINEGNPGEVRKLIRDAQTRIDAHNEVLFERYMKGVGGRIQAEKELERLNSKKV